MKQVYITNVYGERRDIHWVEFTSITKDILWHYDRNFRDPINAFIPANCFVLKYWEYLNMEGDRYFYEEEKEFIKEGCLAVINGMTCEYIDIPGGYQKVFQKTSISEVYDYILRFEPDNAKQERLRDITLTGLTIAAAITPYDIEMNRDFVHDDLDRYYKGIMWIQQNVIIAYYERKLGIRIARSSINN